MGIRGKAPLGRLAALGFVALVGLDAAAVAATLNSIQGIVRVNYGSGFQQIAQTAELAPGTSVMAAPGSSAEIIYSNRCRVYVGPGAVVTVSRNPPCSQADLGEDYTGYYLLGAVGIGVGIWAFTQGQNNTPPQPASP